MISSPMIPELGGKLVKVIVAFPHAEMEFQGTTIVYCDVERKILVFREYDNNIVHVVGLPFIVRTNLKGEKK
jgi:negative regulator of replication initiation